jgi:hypothetical protein
MQPFEALTRQRFRVPSSSWLVCVDRTMLTETRGIIIAKATSLIIASCWRSNLTPYCSDLLENKERDRNTQDVVTSVRNIVCWSLSGLKAGAANAVWRARLINRLALQVEMRPITFVTAPRGTGKSTLLEQFVRAEQIRDAVYMTTTFKPGCSPTATLMADFGIRFMHTRGSDARCARWGFPDEWSDQLIVLVIDDAHWGYDDKMFWGDFLRDGAFPIHVRVLIAATNHPEEPVEAKSAAGYDLSRLLLNKEEAVDFLKRSGLRDIVPKETVENFITVISKVCSGHVGLFSGATLNLRHCQRRTGTVKLNDCLSRDMVDVAKRCFGCERVLTNMDRTVMAAVIFADDKTARRSAIPGADAVIDQQIGHGLLIQHWNSDWIWFTSPMACLYLLNCAPAERATINADSLLELAVALISSLSAAVLTAHGQPKMGKLPKPGVFRQQLVNALLETTTPDTFIFPDLFDIFPGEPSPHEVVFYVDGPRRYGIEVLVDACGGRERVRRFSKHGSCAALECDEHMVIDIRAADSAKVTGDWSAEAGPNTLIVSFDRSFGMCYYKYEAGAPTALILMD